ncbi:DEAD/DEAH box helicase family protein [Lactiplantibacillus plantarum]|uniref:DEAD/DEAH box helicase n=1 Tax=Lactiplantibacillus plantarum TaxID=1590 RepID=UPI00377010EF
MIYKESELVLKVSKNVNPEVWDEGFYQSFLDVLFKNRKYEIEATETALRFLNSGEYKNITDLAKENFNNNSIIRERFNNNFEAMKNDLDLADKLSATIDLATGTGKSYVMIALALIMLASKKVNRVLVLVPSLTIESELTQKFNDVISNEQIIKTLGDGFIVPELLNGDSTIVKNSIAIENRNAIYSAQEKRNSIVDSLENNGEDTFVLNDEVHHVYYSESNEWKKFINDDRNNHINFKYIIGVTGTPYKRRTKTSAPNEYFSDVIYRYSLRDAIEQNFVKDIEYIAKEDMPNDKDERWQVILKSHDQILDHLKGTFGEKPITIIVTSRQSTADSQAKKFKKFIKRERGLSDSQVDDVVLSVHSGKKAALDRIKLKYVDNPGNPVEFIFSVSMLTEGWDVKRVFQIVPDEERAFNSKLLIAQVLGRGLRRPKDWKSSWGIPTVTVFNHEKWSGNVQSLVNEILEIRKTLTLTVNRKSLYNFKVLNIRYKTTPTTKETPKLGSYNLWENGVNLPTDDEFSTSKIVLNGVQNQAQRALQAEYRHETFKPDEIAETLYARFLDLEDLNFAKEYQSLWPVDRIKKMILESLKRSGNKVITKQLKNKLLSSMNVIFREGSKSVSYDIKPNEFFIVNTENLPKETSDLLNFKKNKTLFYSDEFEKSLSDDASKESFKEIVDTSNGYQQEKISNKYNFKTPQFAITVSGKPETVFLKRIIDAKVSEKIDSFIKSTDTNFYNFEYSWKKGTHQKHGQFNPDWFIKQNNNYIVVETKDDTQLTDPDPENIGKNKAAVNHFDFINKYLLEMGSNTKYKFIFLTPKNYDVFFEKLAAKEIMNFRSELDIKLLESSD